MFSIDAKSDPAGDKDKEKEGIFPNKGLRAGAPGADGPVLKRTLSPECRLLD